MSEWLGRGRKRALRNLIYYFGILLQEVKPRRASVSQDFKPSFPIHEVGVPTIRLRPLTAKDRILAHVENRTTLFKPLHSCHSAVTEVFYARVPILVSCGFMHVFPSL